MTLFHFLPALIFSFGLSAFAQDPATQAPTDVQQAQAQQQVPNPQAPPQPVEPTYQAPVQQYQPPVQQYQPPVQQYQQYQPSTQNAGLPARPAPREERFVPSEVIASIPGAKQTSEVRAVLRTSMGDITIKLNRNRTPQTVNHFIALARGEKEFLDVKTSKKVKRPFYNGLIFHRVTRGYLVQTGCPFGNGRGGPGDIATIKDEIVSPMKFDRPGLVAMAPMRDNDGKKMKKNTNGSQFFITLRPMPEWDDQYTIFGEVEDGMDVLKKISNSKVGPTERPIKRIYLQSVDIYEGEMTKAAPAAGAQSVQPFAPAADGNTPNAP